jgi:outer membrane protein
VQHVLARHAQSEIRPETLPLSLRECIALALERNFDIRIEGFNPKIRTADVVNERAEFDTSLFAGYLFSGGKEQLNDAPSRFPPNGAAKVETSTPLVGVEQRLQTGTRFALQLNQQHITSSETNSTARVVNPSNEIRTIFSLTQPILRNLGLDVNRPRIRIAETNQEVSESQLKDRVIRVVSGVQGLYWDLVFRIRELGVRRLSLRLAQDLLNQTRIQVAVGTLPHLSILEGEAGVAAREEAVIVAENDVRTVDDRLKEVLSFFEDRRQIDTTIAPADPPQFTIAEVDLPKSLEEAFEQRPDYRQARLEIEARTLNERFTSN